MLLKYLHIVLIFSGIALIYGTEIVLHRIGRSGDTAAIRTAFRVAAPIANAAPVVFFAGLGFGLAAAVVNGYNLSAPWLLASYVLVAGLIFSGITVTAPWMRRVGAVAAASPDGAPGTELTAALHARVPTILLGISIAADVAIVALMVFKPGA